MVVDGIFDFEFNIKSKQKNFLFKLVIKYIHYKIYIKNE
jgi:hypothetical protein